MADAPKPIVVPAPSDRSVLGLSERSALERRFLLSLLLAPPPSRRHRRGGAR